MSPEEWLHSHFHNSLIEPHRDLLLVCRSQDKRCWNISRVDFAAEKKRIGSFVQNVFSSSAFKSLWSVWGRFSSLLDHWPKQIIRHFGFSLSYTTTNHQGVQRLGFSCRPSLYSPWYRSVFLFVSTTLNHWPQERLPPHLQFFWQGRDDRFGRCHGDIVLAVWLHFWSSLGQRRAAWWRSG